jgi:hypothetical protein
MCWFRNSDLKWEYVKCVRVLTQACLLDYHLVTFTKRFIIFVYSIMFVHQCYLYITALLLW